jgi:pyrroloquinoline quinone (PQQ) biosynthesis protein C
VSIDHLKALQLVIQPLRDQLIHHRVYAMVDSLSRLQVFMEHHVFAVWDFMSLLKALQQSQTCVEVPWVPKSRPIVARFVNEIVLGEESDEDGRGGYTSHFELYREAMRESGASTVRIDRLVESLSGGININQALMDCHAAPGVAEFVRTTWAFITSKEAHSIAAAFTFGREDVIPEMFRRFVDALHGKYPGRFQKIKYYLMRHIDLDENSHAPLAIKAIHELCGTDDLRWQEATEAARSALQARINFWEAIAAAMREDQTAPFETPLLRRATRERYGHNGDLLKDVFK